MNMLNYFMAMCMIVLMSCKEDQLPILDFTDPFGDSAENNAPIPSLAESTRPILICEQSLGQVLIIDSLSKGQLWSWKATEALPAQQAAWFSEIDEAKAVYNRQYVLLTASSGGVALVRVKDKKVMFYTNAKGSPHSAELLPDGNIVVACSSNGTADGDALKLYRIDSLQALVSAETKRYNLTFGHNAVWDVKRNVLWATDDQNLYSYSYNGDRANPELVKNADFFALPDKSPHDLFPVYGKEQLYLTTAAGIYLFDMQAKTFTPHAYTQANIKSVSDGPAGFGTLIVKPNNSWWTDRLTNIRGSSIFYVQGYKMYKARWFVDNPFSYPVNHSYTQTR